MTTYESAIEEDVLSPGPSPGSPPGMTGSKSSKSSSFHSLGSDDNSVLADTNHFEDIGLEDDVQYATRHLSDPHLKSAPNPYSASFSSDLRAVSLKRSASLTPRPQGSRETSRTRQTRDALSRPKARPSLPGLQNQVRNISVRTTGLGIFTEPQTSPLPLRHLGSRPSHNKTSLGRHQSRSPSPSFSLGPHDPSSLTKPRRSSWQSSRERKSILELELECDEDDGDDIPDGLVLDNVPISPRLPQERSRSRASSKAGSPERAHKETVRSVGNGTPAVAVARGSLRSPTWRSDTAVPSLKAAATSDAQGARAKSWTAALADLNAEARALTEKLEEHADELEHKYQRSSTGSIPTRKSPDHYDTKPRVRSALADLPPLRRTNIMIDPLPISKEKEAVLSRTRPSWLPPKDPAEERRHLKEYQKMMAQSLEANRRREAAKRVRSECRDTAADSIMRLWEDDILPRWNEAIRERRTRELWWHGIAPRSRGAVWSRAIGNELGLTETSYRAALGRAEDAEAKIKAGHGTAESMRYAAWFEAIRKDVETRTWPDLRIFQVEGPLHQTLTDVLRAYAMYRSDIGYVPGCNTIAALLLLNLPTPANAFIALANLLNRPLPLSFYVSDAGAKASAYNLLLQTLSQKSPDLHDHLMRLPDHDPNVYLADVFTALFTSHLALDEAARLWDVYVFEGDALLIRAGVALLLQKEMALLGTSSVGEVRKTLGQLSDGARGPKAARVTSGNEEENRWMKAMRDVGKV